MAKKLLDIMRNKSYLDINL